MITKEQIEKIIDESYSNYPKFLSSTIEKIEIRFKAQATLHRVRKIEYIVTNPGPVADRLRRDLANYFTALGFFGGLGMNENGDIVIARIQGETATVKRLFHEKDHIRLQPENDAFSPIFVSPQDIEVAGKVIGLMRAIS